MQNRRRWSVESVSLWVILALAFALSFRALYDVGAAAGLGASSWALPVIVDGFAVLAARVIERLDSRLARLYPWALLVGLVAVSSWWNALHAGGSVDLTPWQARIVAGAPPVILGLAYHLRRMVAGAEERTARKQARAEERRSAQRSPTGQRAARAQDAPSNGAPAPAPKVNGAPVADTAPTAPANGAPPTSNRTERTTAPRRGSIKAQSWEWYQERRAAGYEPSAPELAEAVPQSGGNSRKLIDEFAARWEIEGDRPKLVAVAGEGT